MQYLCKKYSTFKYLNRWHKELWYCQCEQQKSTFPCQHSLVQWGRSQRCRYTRCWRPRWSRTFQSFPAPEQHNEGLRWKDRANSFIFHFWSFDISKLIETYEKSKQNKSFYLSLKTVKCFLINLMTQNTSDCTPTHHHFQILSLQCLLDRPPSCYLPLHHLKVHMMKHPGFSKKWTTHQKVSPGQISDIIFFSRCLTILNQRYTVKDSILE